MDILNKIKALLDKKKISQIEFANKIGMSRQSLYNFLQGKTEINVSTLQEIANILEVPITYFFGGSEETISKKEYDSLFDEKKEITCIFLLFINTTAVRFDRIIEFLNDVITDEKKYTLLNKAYKDLNKKWVDEDLSFYKDYRGPKPNSVDKNKDLKQELSDIAKIIDKLKDVSIDIFSKVSQPHLTKNKK